LPSSKRQTLSTNTANGSHFVVGRNAYSTLSQAIPRRFTKSIHTQRLRISEANHHLETFPALIVHLPEQRPNSNSNNDNNNTIDGSSKYGYLKLHQGSGRPRNNVPPHKPNPFVRSVHRSRPNLGIMSQLRWDELRRRCNQDLVPRMWACSVTRELNMHG